MFLTSKQINVNIKIMLVKIGVGGHWVSHSEIHEIGFMSQPVIPLITLSTTVNKTDYKYYL